MAFPKEFVWGAASASYQVEGAAYEDGKGLSVWDVFCKNEGKILKGDTGDVSCDHYHHYKEDVALMKDIGLDAYRFSISWPRVLPTGVGAVNVKGLDFYSRLVDELLAAGIKPYATLFHWDYPYDLFCRGGWFNEDSSDWFAQYAQVIVDALSDRVSCWMTVNEPNVFVRLGHRAGIHAPGMTVGTSESLRLMRNVMLSHGKAAQVIRAEAKTPPIIGFAKAIAPYVPVSDSSADIEAAREINFEFNPEMPGSVSCWMDPMMLGQMPEMFKQLECEGIATVTDVDLKTIHQPMDFCGLNIYTGKYARAGSDGKPEIVPFKVGQEHTGYPWPVLPETHYWAPKFAWERYKKPIMIAESGLSNVDIVDIDGAVHDGSRIAYLGRYLSEYERAIDDGVEAMGYLQWSIMDNFEWSHGYKDRFGLIYVDYPTGKRIPKDSAKWYSKVIKTNGEDLHF